MNASAEQAQFDEFVIANAPADIVISKDVMKTLHGLYHQNDTSLGGRFNTGDSLFDRAEAWFTDQMYLSPRRFFFEHAAGQQPLFGYLFDEFYPGADPNLGGNYWRLLKHSSLAYQVFYPVSHGSELRLIFGGAPASESGLSVTFTDAYLNFVNDLNPGGM